MWVPHPQLSRLLRKFRVGFSGPSHRSKDVLINYRDDLAQAEGPEWDTQIQFSVGCVAEEFRGGFGTFGGMGVPGGSGGSGMEWAFSDVPL